MSDGDGGLQTEKAKLFAFSSERACSQQRVDSVFQHEQRRHCLHENSDGGHAEFLARRVEEYQRTLRVIYGRVRESDQENQLTQDLERLMQQCKI